MFDPACNQKGQCTTVLEAYPLRILVQTATVPVPLVGSHVAGEKVVEIVPPIGRQTKILKEGKFSGACGQDWS